MHEAALSSGTRRRRGSYSPPALACLAAKALHKLLHLGGQQARVAHPLALIITLPGLGGHKRAPRLQKAHGLRARVLAGASVCVWGGPGTPSAARARSP